MWHRHKLDFNYQMLRDLFSFGSKPPSGAPSFEIAARELHDLLDCRTPKGQIEEYAFTGPTYTAQPAAPGGEALQNQDSAFCTTDRRNGLKINASIQHQGQAYKTEVIAEATVPGIYKVVSIIVDNQEINLSPRSQAKEALQHIASHHMRGARLGWIPQPLIPPAPENSAESFASVKKRATDIYQKLVKSAPKKPGMIYVERGSTRIV
jgi:hypothetical protein